MDPQVERTLREVFGFDGWREGQKAVIERLLEGRSTLAVFPTGGGKSLCYQLPALCLGGLTVVISPLIALMKDQVDALVARGVAAARLDSSLGAEGTASVMARLRDGQLRLLFLAPERLANERFRETLARRPIELLAVDEAHCVSEWGHNFRPEYLKIASAARELRVGRVLALTATATPSVAADIARSFGIAAEDVVRNSGHRANLDLAFEAVTAAERLPTLIARMRAGPRGPAVVYVTQQKTAEAVARDLSAAGIRAEAYHAGLEPEVRAELQERFMASPNGVIVATIAFGMGIDKADIRSIYHYNLPKSLEGYAQEIGRAGRDGRPAQCRLLACPEDRTLLENFSYGDTPDPIAVQGLYAELIGQPDRFDVAITDLSFRFDIRPLVVETALTYLELEGWLAATGPFYTEYRYRWNRPVEAALAPLDETRRAFLNAVLACGGEKRVWTTLEPATAAATLGERRERIVAALGWLEQTGAVELGVSGVREGYRWERRPTDDDGVAVRLANRFLQREATDVARVAQVIAFVEGEGCRTNALLSWFGEDIPPCGHCSGCRGERVHLATTEVDPGQVVTRVRAVQAALRPQPALATPRAMTRFLCGLPSPRAGRARLTRSPHYGALEGAPFGAVLAAVEATGARG